MAAHCGISRIAIPAPPAQCTPSRDQISGKRSCSLVGPSGCVALSISNHDEQRRKNRLKSRILASKFRLEGGVLHDSSFHGRRFLDRSKGSHEQRLSSCCCSSSTTTTSSFQARLRSRGLSWMQCPASPRVPLLNRPQVSTSAVARASVGPTEPQATSLKWLNDEKVSEKDSEGDESSTNGMLGIEDHLKNMLPSHPKLHRGQLDNGLRYVILPNKVPPNRFEAHMEMHVGSVDEEEHEQGIAHMIEHVTFLGSKKREKLLGTGARSNAYTDFHHTVFHVHSPVTAQGTNEPLLPLVLDALHEIAFKPKFLASRIEKERSAVLSELQMMNTIEYRVDCQLLQQLHSENLLGYRFPIGLEEQIKQWDVETIKAFHDRWYFPANATLFIVGDIGSVGRTIELIEAQFGSTPAGLHHANLASPLANILASASQQLPKLQKGLAGPTAVDPPPVSFLSAPTRKERHAIRPPVKHSWSLPGISGENKVPYIFQHELLQNFSLNLFCKTPIQRVQTYSDIRDVLMRRIVLSTYQFRISTRYKSANPPFISIELDHSDSGREGCTVTTLAVTAEPKDWSGALKVAVQEISRLKEHGVTKGELARYLNALLKDSEHLAAMIDSVPSIDNLDFIMESDAVGHTVMDQQQGYEALLAVADSVTLEDVHATAKSMLQYVADFGDSNAPVPAAIVACVPKSLHENGRGDIEFKITPDEIVESIKSGLSEPLAPEAEFDVPDELVSAAELSTLKMQRKPCFVPVTDGGTLLKIVNEQTGIVMRRLSNGMRVNYKITQNEAKGGVMRLVVAGGRARETSDASGAVAVGVRTFSEGGVVGGYSREQVELFCVTKLINCVLEADEEFMCMDFHFTMRDGGMKAAFQLLHLVMERNVWLEDALDRAKQLYMSHFRAMPKSLERATAYKLMCAMFDGDERLLEPNPSAIEKLTLPVVREAVMKQLVTGNMELCIVGDFSEHDIETCILDYLGTVAPEKDVPARKEIEAKEKPVVINPSPKPEVCNQKLFLKDTDERACAYVAGPAPNRWGYTVDGLDLNVLVEPVPKNLTEQQARALAPPGVEVIQKPGETGSFWKRPRHPLYGSVAMTLLAEIINARLFTNVRDALGLTYDVSFEFRLFDRLKGGWFVISVTSTPTKIQRAVEASINVLKGLHSNQITQRELDRAKRILMMRHESDCKDNKYWLGLITHLQAPSVGRKNVSCIRDLAYLYELATIDDVYNAYKFLGLDEKSVYTCIGVAGTDTDGGGGDSALTLEEDTVEELPVALPGSHFQGRGMSTMTRPTT
ncbi:stromal processing peptidase, chloroplastic [Selaginella moellendorffii]|uniref:stromal processing peptidase, chloroplastic n=1 Tax=Selaginella moellendorffii TaxID=88036 RepID=UPI000D1C694D|nr:stromal processing peptidase, chloroplastic [Selaginella moellendorffii]|eukprot:XP_024530004.1 stromal processing peptidase, chloroplastic [Selaginella moellendorffii]